MLADEKERAEHVMLVDLGRNDLGRVSEYGSVKVRDLMYVERYSHVMHLVSALEGRLRPELNAMDAFAACFPAGTLSGAPKVRAMQIIEELEPTRRGVYGGAVLYADFAGNLDSCIAIRTLLMKGKKAYLQAGAGIVADSDPQREFEETENKARAVLRAVEMARGSSRTHLGCSPREARLWIALSLSTFLDLTGCGKTSSQAESVTSAAKEFAEKVGFRCPTLRGRLISKRLRYA